VGAKRTVASSGTYAMRVQCAEQTQESGSCDFIRNGPFLNVATVSCGRVDGILVRNGGDLE